MPPFPGLVQAVDRAWEAEEKGHRPHLGASQVGKPCARALVYGFRHAVAKRTEGRMLRLFNRGHREEPSINQSLRMIGFEVREYAERLTWHDPTASYAALPWGEPLSPDLTDVSDSDAHVQCAALAGVKLKQWAFGDVGGHHAGSTDGKARVPAGNPVQFPELPAGVWFGLEFKTYNTKGFKILVEAGDVIKVKPEHYSQMQEYMHYMELTLCLYIGVCKENDQWYSEVVPYDQAAAEAAVARAREAVCARQLPPRLSNNATNMACKFCDYRSVCHFGEDLLKSCRTCRHAAAVPEGGEARWHCAKWNSLIPVDAVRHGCDGWETITD